jgi:aspartyl-tRNA(Asn)/glutamyl-tRNA(Gln) amidotransferase subunit A
MDKSLRDLARGLRAHELSSADLVREAGENLEASEPRLGAYKTRTREMAEAGAKQADAALRSGRDTGVFQGIPVSIKDIYGVPGVPIFAGSSRELPAKWQSAGPVARCLLDGLAVVMGKTHTVEFAFGALGLNSHWPTPRNPWDARDHRAPGGSSSGAGVSLCQGSAVIALGTDTGGSVRIPAALTGNVGYKSTIGRWSTEGIVPLSPYLDTPGILARTVDDALLAAAEMDRYFGIAAGAIGSAAAPGSLRIGIPEHLFFGDCDPGIFEGVMGALHELERAGHRLVPMPFPEAAQAFEMFKGGGTAGAELLAFLRHELPEWIAQLDPNVGTRMTVAAELSAADYLARRMAIDELAAAARMRFANVDVIAAPTTAQSPPILSTIRGWDEYRPLNLKMARNTSVANFLQLNALSIPVALDAARMPVGLQIICDRGKDDLLFAAGLSIEKVLGTGRERLGPPPSLSLGRGSGRG